MAPGDFFRRHKVAVASNTALVLAVGVVAGYALNADGYQAHEAQLNDGGIWVVNGDRGLYGRINKPIDQLDSTVFAKRGDLPLDVVQEGAAVVALDRRASTAQVIDPVTSALDASGRISIPSAGDQQMGGGSFASIDAETGDLWAVRLDAQRGKPLITALERQAKPLDTVGEGAALAVTSSGTVVATSSQKHTVTYVVESGAKFEKPRTEDLPAGAGAPTAVTTVGERVITLDGATGDLQVLGGGTASVPPGAVLQQASAAADAVLVATDGALMSIDLDSGTVTIVTEDRNGTPAEPVRLGTCVYGAWSGGLGAVAVQCGNAAVEQKELTGKASNLLFRVNRGEIVLNDATSGAVWEIDSPQPEQIDNWNAFTATKKVEDKEKLNEEQSSGDRRPPKAKADNYGARSGRTSVLHPLDNDSAPEGRLLSIIDVDQPTGGAQVEISPDGQTLVLQLPEKAQDTAFDYYIDDGRSNFSAHARVSVAVRASGANAPPTVRVGFEPRRWRVPASGSITVPVLSDWRDDRDGDNLVLDSAVVLGSVDSGATARTTSDGRLRFTGSRAGDEEIQVEYAVSDGRSSPVKKSMSFQVQGRLDRESFPPVAEPDVVRGEVDKPIKIRPLLNDLPGSDPGTDNAALTLGGKVPGQAGTTIKSDLENGIITFTGAKPGTYFLEYDAAFGNAPLDKNTVRVDVRPAPKSPGDPVAMPDGLIVYGQSAGVVDVLANDVDPAGGMLVVQRAVADNPNQLDVAVIEGRWLRISARQGELAPNPQLVHYSISNGANAGVEGEVSVSQRAAPPDNAPVTTTDRVNVRAGTSVTVPVLDNDISPSGDRLTLVGDAAQDVAGELEIDVPVDVKGDVGTAYVAGRTVRYIAPDLLERDSFDIRYIARNSTGETAIGRLIVTITPADAPNTAPEPPTIEGRVVSGGTVKVRLPGSGIDPDGDPVTVTGITSAPRLGRVLSYGGNFLEYQAYPRTTDTDEFEYSVVDSRGAVATGLVRIGVVAPGEPQPPLAVADQLSVEPGRTAVFDPLANDYIAPGDQVTLTLRDAPEGVRLDPDTNLVSVPTPGDPTAPTPVIVYEITNGINTSIATMNVDLTEQFNNPPVVSDAFGRVDDSESVSVDVLEGAYDPDGRVEGLSLTKVYGTEGDPTINGNKVKVNRGPYPLVVPFRVEDAEGAAATGSLYVPPTGTGIPYVKTDALIELDEGGSVTGKLKDYVVDPSGGRVRLTGRDSVSASPAALSPTRSGDGAFKISARAGYRGPGALLVEVTTATDEVGNEDPNDPADGYTALLSIPVQVGNDVPVLECPQSTIAIAAGERLDLDIASLCNVWTPDPADVADLDYEGTWAQSVDGLTVEGNGGAALSVIASTDATGGGDAVLSITAGGSEPGEIRFRVAKSPPPRLLPIRVEDMEAGQVRTLDLASYLDSRVPDPRPTVVSVQVISGAGVSASKDGRSGVTLRTTQAAKGRAVIRVVMSDVDDSSPSAERRAEGRIEFEMAGLPGQPGAPQDYDNEEKGTVRLGWFPPKDNGGSPITRYEVKEMQTGRIINCRTNECDFPGLENAKKYNFRVAAVNKVGRGPWSDLSRTAYAATPPGRVKSITMLARADHTITIGWSKPESSTRIEQYRLSWLGGSVAVDGSTTQYAVPGLDNNKTYVFSIEALNSVNWSGTRQSEKFQSIGTPGAPGGLSIKDQESGVQATAVRASWAATAPEGPAPTFYTLSYSTQGRAPVPVPGCSRIQALTCVHGGIPYDGAVYSYYVQALNAKNASLASAAVGFSAVAKPLNWDPSWTATATGNSAQLRVTAKAPDSRGSESRAAILVAGQVVWEQPVAAGATINELVATPGNEAGYPVQLRMCNENTVRVGCSVAESKTAQSYGPLNGTSLDISPVVNGKNISWVITGNANGDPVVVNYQIDGYPLRSVRPGVTGKFSIQTEAITSSDYEREERISVRVFDDAPADRGQVVGENRARSGDRPLPAIEASRVACNDGPGGTVACQSGEYSPYPCLDQSCAFVAITTTNFGGEVSCHFMGGMRGNYSANGLPADGTTRTPYYYGWTNETFNVTCWSGVRSASTSVTW